MIFNDKEEEFFGEDDFLEEDDDILDDEEESSESDSATAEMYEWSRIGRSDKSSPFVHLHNHTEFSLLDGACKIDDMCKKAVSLGMPSVTITDHGNMFGAIQFYKTAEKHKLKPIIGIELYLSPTSRFDKQMTEKQSNNHIVLLSENLEGYKNLIKLASIAYVDGFYYKPRIDLDILQQYSKNLICLSGCLKGYINDAILDNNHKEAEKRLGKFVDIFGKERFFLELMDHGLKEQSIVNKAMLKLSKKFGVDVVATNDCHYIDKDDSVVQDILLCIQTGKTIEEKERFKFKSDQFFFKNFDEMFSVFSEIPEALNNTLKISEMCNTKIPLKQNLLPMFVPPDGKSQNDYLEELVWKGMQKRYPNLTDELKNRVEYELGVIHKMKFDSYFLIVSDFIHEARKMDIPVGPGRGSAAGSIVAFALGITDIDPIQHNLIFERFLNPERKSMPDIDIDFCYVKRAQVIDYVRNKYGKKNVSQIITFGSMKARNAIRDVGRALGIDLKTIDKISKMIPPKLTIMKAVKEVPDLEKEVKSNPAIENLIKLASKIEGHVRHPSLHAAGIVISSEELDKILPLFKNPKDNEIATQFNMKEVEEIGLLKMDFLGLKNLTIIEDSIKRIEKANNIKIDWDTIPLTDPKTFELLQSGSTDGVFQLESDGMRDIVKRLQPEKFDEITALLALYRPGPLGSGMHNDFIDRKHGRRPIIYDHPILEPILKETYGVILYQEQVMQIAVSIAGFSLGKADEIRRIMGKKLGLEQMRVECAPIINGAVERGMKHEVASKIVDQLIHFAGYGFNKSHSAAYALLTFRTAYLKAHYPVHFMAAYLTSEITKKEKIGYYFAVCKGMGIEMLPPDVNESDSDFTVVGDNIRFGLAGIQNVGRAVVDTIISERNKNGKFKEFYDFVNRTAPLSVNSRTFESLIKSGACDSFKVNRSSLFKVLPEAIEIAQNKAKEKAQGQLSLFEFLDSAEEENNSFAEIKFPEIPEWSDHERLQYEKELLGFYITGHPLERFIIDMHSFADVNASTLKECRQNHEVSIIGMITRVSKKIDKNKKQFAFVDIEDFEGTATLLVFSEAYEKYKNMLELDKVIWAKGKYSSRGKDQSITVDEIKPADELRKEKAQCLNIELQTHSVNEENLTLIKKTLKTCKGDKPVKVVVNRTNCGKAAITINKDLFVDFREDFLKELLKLNFPKEIYFSKN